MHSLEELHLIDLEELESVMGVLAKSIQNLDNLRVLDVHVSPNFSNTKLRSRDVSALVPLLVGNTNKMLKEVDISPAIISKHNMLSLWMALHYNIHVCDLIYSRSNCFAINEIVAIEMELSLN